MEDVIARKCRISDSFYSATIALRENSKRSGRQSLARWADRFVRGIGGRCWNRTSDPRRVKAMSTAEPSAQFRRRDEQSSVSRRRRATRPGGRRFDRPTPCPASPAACAAADQPFDVINLGLRHRAKRSSQRHGQLLTAWRTHQVNTLRRESQRRGRIFFAEQPSSRCSLPMCA